MSFFSSLRNTLTQHTDRLSAEEFIQRHDDHSVVLDVRTPGEFAQGRVEGAQNIDVTAPDFREAVGQLDAGKTYYLYCRSGNRSVQATRVMREMGYDAYNIGGLNTLARAGASITR